METAITKSNLAFVYNRSLPDSVYTRSFPRFCLYQVIARLFFITGWCYPNHTSVRGAASAWAAGTLPSSDCDGVCATAFEKRVSWLMALAGAGWCFQCPQQWAAGLGVLLQQLRVERLLSRRWCLDVGRTATAGKLFQASL